MRHPRGTRRLRRPRPCGPTLTRVGEHRRGVVHSTGGRTPGGVRSTGRAGRLRRTGPTRTTRPTRAHGTPGPTRSPRTTRITRPTRPTRPTGPARPFRTEPRNHLRRHIPTGRRRRSRRRRRRTGRTARPRTRRPRRTRRRRGRRTPAPARRRRRLAGGGVGDVPGVGRERPPRRTGTAGRLRRVAAWPLGIPVRRTGRTRTRPTRSLRSTLRIPIRRRGAPLRTPVPHTAVGLIHGRRDRRTRKLAAAGDQRGLGLGRGRVLRLAQRWREDGRGQRYRTVVAGIRVGVGPGPGRGPGRHRGRVLHPGPPASGQAEAAGTPA